MIAHAVEHVVGEEWEGRSEHVTHETLSSDGRRRVFTVGVREIVVDSQKDVVDTQDNWREGEDWDNVVYRSELCPSVPEHTNREQDGTDESTVESGFWDRDATVLRCSLLVHVILDEVGCESDKGTEGETNVRETLLTDVPVVVVLEGEWDDREEQEDNSPCE